MLSSRAHLVTGNVMAGVADGESDLAVPLLSTHLSIAETNTGPQQRPFSGWGPADHLVADRWPRLPPSMEEAGLSYRRKH
jgi:hypothetical protein